MTGWLADSAHQKGCGVDTHTVQEIAIVDAVADLTVARLALCTWTVNDSLANTSSQRAMQQHAPG